MIIFCRFYHISAVACSIKKQGIKLCKMVNPKSKKQWYPSQAFEGDSLPTVKSLTKVKHEPGKRGIRRLAMLNKMFMKQITDMMSTGTVAMDVVGRGIEISKVKVTPDFHTVNVFWVCKGTSTDDEVEKVLNGVAGALRHELSTLRVMGVVPYIEFVKDRQEAQVVDLDRRLSLADYGDDYEPTDPGHILKSEFTLDTKLSPEIMAKIKYLEEEHPITEEPIPEMTHTIYGLDHAKIMCRLLAARKKSKDAWNNLDTETTVISYRTPENKLPTTELTNQRQELADFLQQRQILQQKLQKQLRDARKDWQIPKSDDLEDSDDDIYEEYSDEADDYYSDDEISKDDRILP